MSVLVDDIKSVSRSRVAAPVVHGAAPADAAALCSCRATSLSSPAGEIIVVHVAGEVDLFTISVLQTALTESLARGPCHLIVDLAELTFCGVRGLSLLVQAGPIAAANGTGFAVSAASRHINRVWAIVWSASELPTQHPTAATAVLAVSVGSKAFG